MESCYHRRPLLVSCQCIRPGRSRQIRWTRRSLPSVANPQDREELHDKAILPMITHARALRGWGRHGIHLSASSHARAVQQPHHDSSHLRLDIRQRCCSQSRVSLSGSPCPILGGEINRSKPVPGLRAMLTLYSLEHIARDVKVPKPPYSTPSESLHDWIVSGYVP
nr:hypothetical protein CFP56_58155 [Quercus suber]